MVKESLEGGALLRTLIDERADLAEVITAATKENQSLGWSVY